MKGKLIVIEGTDGSGKKTQTALLTERLRNGGHKVKTISFPQYGKRSAKKVEDYLAGKFGPPGELDPYKVSPFYAEDRLGAAPEIKKALEAGETVVLDRYIDSNVGHQGGKIADPTEREEFIKWLYDYEYKKLGIPKPDLTLILRVPYKITLKLMEGRGGAKDGHEADKEHLRNAEAAYLWLAAKRPKDHRIIECVRGEEILPPEDIHRMVYEAVNPLLTPSHKKD